MLTQDRISVVGKMSKASNTWRSKELQGMFTTPFTMEPSDSALFPTWSYFSEAQTSSILITVQKENKLSRLSHSLIFRWPGCLAGGSLRALLGGWTGTARWLRLTSPPFWALHPSEELLQLKHRNNRLASLTWDLWALVLTFHAITSFTIPKPTNHVNAKIQRILKSLFHNI